jgi:enoyl-[acyl-carrier protein] reductase I
MRNLVSLSGKKGLIVGIANSQSIAYGCAKIFHELGATLAITYLNDKAEAVVRPLAENLQCPIIAACDFRIPGQLEAVFDSIKREWGSLDFILHSVAYAAREDLHGRLIDCSQSGFCLAMDISCHSFIRVAKQAEPLMKNGGCLLTVSFYGGEKVIPHYSLMGPVKAALESSVMYLANELSAKKIRVHALSPGPLETRAAAGIDQFDELLEKVKQEVPSHTLISIEDVGNLAAFLVSDAAPAMTGNIEFVDEGYHVLG